MEEDNIYADLPNFNLTESDINNQPKTDHACNCEELEKKLILVTNELESIKNINENLEKNLASLLKTAKAEITRKDRMIEDLRNQLDNITFRRNKSGSLDFPIPKLSHHHNTMAEKYENVTPLMNSEEDTFMSQQIEPSYTEYKSKKPQNNIEQVPVTIFGERLYKKIMDDKREEKKLKTLKLNSETNMNKIPEESIIESDKENGSQSGINNNINESNTVTRSSNSDTSYKKNPGKRLNEENDTYKSKHFKTEDNKDKNDDNIDCKSMMQNDTKDDFTKLEDQLCVMYSIKKEQAPLETRRRATSEYGDTKQTQNYKNEWRKDERTSMTKNYDDTRARKGSVDNSRSRTASISNERFNSDHQYDHYINSYRKNDYRHSSSSSRSSFKSRIDCESPSSHYSWEKSNRSYRDRKYDDYKYDNRHKNDRSRRGYDKETSGVRTRYSSRERGDLRDRSRHTSDEERRGRSGSYKNKYDNHKLKETIVNVSEDKRSYKSKAAVEIDSRMSFNRPIENTIVDHSVGKNTEQHNAKDEPCAPARSSESTLTCAITKNKNHLEEGEILDSPNSTPQKNDSAKNLTIQVTKENVAEASIQMEDTSGNMPVSIQGNAESTSHCVKNDLAQLNSVSEHISTIADTCFHNLAISDLHSDKIVTHSSLPSPGIIGNCNNNDNYQCENCIDENVEDDIVNPPVEEMYDFNNENIRNEEVSNANVEDTTEVNEVTTILGSENSLPFNDNYIRQTDREDVVSSTSDKVTPVETVLNCDNIDRSEVFNGNVTSHQIPDNNNTEVSRSCLNDHNYVRDTIIDVFNLDAVPSTLERRESVPDTVISKGPKTEGKVNIQSIETKKTTSTTVKSKKDQKAKAVVISRRRKAVTLSDNNASMTVLINTDSAGSSLVVDGSVSDKSDSVSKPRACKLARTIKQACK